MVRVAFRVVALYVPEILADVPCTGLVVTVNVALVAVAGIVTDGGTCAAEVLLLVKVTTAPAEGAGPLRMTVPVDGLPPITVLGFSVSEVSVGGFIVSVAFLVVL
jgi:hypothetical protein